MDFGSIRALSSALVANAGTAVLMAAFQLASVPVLLSRMGAGAYGEWIVVSAVAAYFQIADVGLNSATANSMTFAYTRGESTRFQRLLSTNFVFLLVSFSVVAAVLALAIMAGLPEGLLRPHVIEVSDVHRLLWLLLAQVAVGTFANSLTSVYRAVDGYPRSVMVDNLFRFWEYAAFLGCIVLGRTLVAASAAVLFVKCLGFLAKWRDARAMCGFSLSPAHADRQELRRQLRPAMSFLLFPVGNAIALQGPLLLINAWIGPAAVVAFSTMRTLVNLGRAPVDIVHRSIWPQFALLFGRSDWMAFASLYRFCVSVTSALVLCFGIGIMAFGESIYTAWTRGGPAYSAPLAGTFIVGLLTSSLLAAGGTALQATNQHSAFGVRSLVGAIGVLLLSWVLLVLTHSITLVPLAVAAVDTAIMFYVMPHAARLARARHAEAFA